MDAGGGEEGGGKGEVTLCVHMYIHMRECLGIGRRCSGRSTRQAGWLEEHLKDTLPATIGMNPLVFNFT